MSEKQKTKIKKLTKEQIIEYYHRISHPHLYNLEYVPVDMQCKAFQKLLLWQGVEEPDEVKEDRKLQKFTFEIKCTD